MCAAGARPPKATGRVTQPSTRVSSYLTRLSWGPCSWCSITLRKTNPQVTPFYYAYTLAIHFCCLLPSQCQPDGFQATIVVFAVTAKPRELLTIGIGLVAVMSVGITGSLAALGDTIFPAASLQSSLMQDFSSSSHHLLRLRLLHPVTVVLGTISVLWIVRKSLARQAHSSKTLPFLIGMLILHVGLGVMNVILLAPVWLQFAHLLVADLFWILLAFASADLLLEIRSCQSVVKPKRAIEVKRIPASLSPDSLFDFCWHQSSPGFQMSETARLSFPRFA